MSKHASNQPAHQSLKNHHEGVIKQDELLEEVVERNHCAFISVHYPDGK